MRNHKYRVKCQCKDGIKYKTIKATSIEQAKIIFYEKYPNAIILDMWKW